MRSERELSWGVIACVGFFFFLVSCERIKYKGMNQVLRCVWDMYKSGGVNGTEMRLLSNASSSNRFFFSSNTFPLYRLREFCGVGVIINAPLCAKRNPFVTNLLRVWLIACCFFPCTLFLVIYPLYSFFLLFFLNAVEFLSKPPIDSTGLITFFFFASKHDSFLLHLLIDHLFVLLFELILQIFEAFLVQPWTTDVKTEKNRRVKRRRWCH